MFQYSSKSSKMYKHENPQNNGSLQIKKFARIASLLFTSNHVSRC